MPSEHAAKALENLRNGSSFNWSIIPILVLYVYSVEVERKNWNVLFAGLAFWVMDWFNEIWNALVLHFSGYAPMWADPGNTAFLILIGLNIEIAMMFAICYRRAAEDDGRSHPPEGQFKRPPSSTAVCFGLRGWASCQLGGVMRAPGRRGPGASLARAEGAEVLRALIEMTTVCPPD